ncbi:MAG: DUF624 domain-containing protein [Clostridiales bacterium]|nr:DUF624 domain-containing protein [Clostridiales bacterium]
MGDFFSLDGPFNKFGNILADIMILGLIWFVCCLPVVTAGASTTALFYVMTRRISNREGYILKDFFGSFKANFKVATLVWLTVLAVGLILFFNVQNSAVMGALAVYFVPVQWAVFIGLCFTAIYAFPLLSRFTMGYRALFKTAFFLAYRHFLTTVVCMLMVLAILFAAATVFPPLFLVGAGIYAYVSSYLFVRVFRKYRPDLDKDAE